jgi:hypothetical protein
MVKESEGARRRAECGGPVWRWRGWGQSAWTSGRTVTESTARGESSLKGREIDNSMFLVWGAGSSYEASSYIALK